MEILKKILQREKNAGKSYQLVRDVLEVGNA
jgi:hypothetical protein